jgi:hypothetical protein
MVPGGETVQGVRAEFWSMLRELERAQREFDEAGPDAGEVDAACYRLLAAENRLRACLRRARQCGAALPGRCA